MSVVKAGTVSGSVTWGRARGLTGRLDVGGLAFSDKSSLRAGEKIQGRLSLEAQQSGGQWRWRAGVEWLAGEVFWQPLYLQGAGCALRNNVCEMAGIEDAPHGYIIVKGGGIPAISVIGYNRRVDWQELIARLRRITLDNVRAVVQYQNAAGNWVRK